MLNPCHLWLLHKKKSSRFKKCKNKLEIEKGFKMNTGYGELKKLIKI